jgi:AbrB family looped-hinge helix DNA binding protein
MKATITSKGQITIPKAIRERLNLHPGDVLDFDEEAPILTARKGIPPEAFEYARSLMEKDHPYNEMSVMEILDDLRGPVELPPDKES